MLDYVHVGADVKIYIDSENDRDRDQRKPPADEEKFDAKVIEVRVGNVADKCEVEQQTFRS